jgi:hypothetical protein
MYQESEKRSSLSSHSNVYPTPNTMFNPGMSVETNVSKQPDVLRELNVIETAILENQQLTKDVLSRISIVLSDEPTDSAVDDCIGPNTILSKRVFEYRNIIDETNRILIKILRRLEI